MDSPVGSIATTMQLLKTQLANTYALQNWDGLTLTAEQAAERIYLETMPLVDDVSNLDDLRPFAVITKPPSSLVWTAASAPRHYTCRGELVVEFHRSPGDLDANDAGALQREFQNFIGQVVQTYNPAQPGLLELSRTAGYLTISQITEDGPHRSDPHDVKDVGDCWLYYLYVSWGERP